MCQVDPDGPTEEEHRKKSVTKTRYLSYRDEKSTTKSLCKFWPTDQSFQNDAGMMALITNRNSARDLNFTTLTRRFCPIDKEEMINCHWNQQTIIEYVNLNTYLDLYLVSWLINHKMLLFCTEIIGASNCCPLWHKTTVPNWKISDNRLIGRQVGSKSCEFQYWTSKWHTWKYVWFRPDVRPVIRYWFDLELWISDWEPYFQSVTWRALKD